MRRRLRGWRRRWCLFRGHPMVRHEAVVTYRVPARLGPDGSVIEGDDYTMWSMHCERHG